MHKVLFLSTWMTLSVAASAAPVIVPENNCSIEVPAGWAACDFGVRPALVAYQNADLSKQVLLMVLPSPGSQHAVFLQSLKDGMISHGMALDPEQPGTIQGLPSVTVTGHLLSGPTVTAYVVVAGEKMYLLEAVLAPGIKAATDAEVQSVVQSFKFLTPVPPVAGGVSGDYIGHMTFKIVIFCIFLAILIGILVLIIVGIVFIIKRSGILKPKA